jgi:SPP1 family predicted phage head-tail adaptor
MRNGRRNKYAELQRLVEVTTDEGERTQSYATVAREYIGIEPLAGNERWTAKQQQSTVTHQIEMPYRSDVTPEWQAVWNSRTFRFSEVINVGENNRELKIMATEVV